MNQKPTPTPYDDNQPATKGDVRRAQEEVMNTVVSTFDSLATKKDLLHVEERLGRVEHTTERVLEIVQSIDQHFKEHQDLPRKVDEHTEEIFKLKMKS